MAWIRRNFMVFVVLVAVALSFVLNRTDAHDEASAIRAASFEGCVLGNTHAALSAAYQRRTVANARSPRMAADFTAFSRGTAKSLAVYEFIDDVSRATQVRHLDARGQPVAALTKKSSALIKRGCHAVFGD